MPIGINGTVYGDNPGGNSVWDRIESQQDPLVKDSGDDAVSQLANDLNVKLDSSSKDYLLQYWLNEQSSQNAFNRELQASSSQYQRTVEDLKKAGLNPYLAFDSLRGSNPSSSAGNVSGGMYTQRENSKRENTVNTAKGIMTVIGIIAAAIIGAML